ncbi:aldose 1-epimerase [Zavarzinella formosa]|uniref:aldose 1-epimerase n=1 Tax=Zavarzinella formosa TaxID=360055 RepID=UPI00030A055C|nr:aldose 1-epimerase [Zavarzinella formosa]
MLYHIDTEERSAGGVSGTVYQLSHAGNDSSIEVWPAHGFNCLRWKHRGQELLYVAPDWETNPVPTRSGIPILYPFPNRIRDGQFTHDGRTFQLPKNDSTKANAIHGFAPRNGWTISGYGTDTQGAWLHGNFRIAVNAPESVGQWPGDAELNVICRFTGHAIRMTFQVTNKGETSFPFGIGLHPYFQIPGAETINDAELHAPARSIWPLKDSLPSGPRQPVPDELNWQRPRRIASTNLDTVYGNLGVIRSKPEGLLLRAELKLPEAGEQLEVWTTENFRESVLFTPVHRKALCIEPYTCVTDAANLQTKGEDTGWVVLPPGGDWTGIVEFVWGQV